MEFDEFPFSNVMIPFLTHIFQRGRLNHQPEYENLSLINYNITDITMEHVA